MEVPTRWSVVEAGEIISGPIRPLDRTNEREVNCVRKDWYASVKAKPTNSRFPLMRDRLGCGGTDKALYMALRNKLIDTSELRVASSDSGAVVVGWACLDPLSAVLHYVYVRSEFRRRGIAKQLLADMIPKAVSYTHITYDSAAAVGAAPPGWRYSFLKAVI